MDLYTLEFCARLREGPYTEIALNVPYTISDLQRCLSSLDQHQQAFPQPRVKVLARTPLGFPLYKLTFKPANVRLKI